MRVGHIDLRIDLSWAERGNGRESHKENPAGMAVERRHRSPMPQVFQKDFSVSQNATKSSDHSSTCFIAS
jgi:hypothetical protein